MCINKYLYTLVRIQTNIPCINYNKPRKGVFGMIVKEIEKIAYELKISYDFILEIAEILDENKVECVNGDELKVLSAQIMNQIQKLHPIEY